MEIETVVEREGAEQREEIVAACASFTWAARTSLARAARAVAWAAILATGLAAARHARHARHGSDRVRFETALGIP
jgi:hypothetical protein